MGFTTSRVWKESTSRNNVRRPSTKKKTDIVRKTIQNKIKKIKKTQIGLSSREIETLLNNKAHFIGVYAEDELANIIIQSLPLPTYMTKN